MGVPSKRMSLTPEDRGRLTSYAIGITWALVFAIWTPSTYVGVVSQVSVHAWSGLMGVGSLVALIGTLTGRDTKVELSGLYLTLVGALLYLTAQTGFVGTSLFLDHLPLLFFILWHMSLLLPRLFGLESYRRKVRAAAKIGLMP